AEVSTMLGKVDSGRTWVLCALQPVKEGSRGRMRLLGDDGRTMRQYLAQGAGIAIEDSVCLADSVDEPAGDFPAAFQVYQAARYLRTARVQVMARVYGEIFHTSGVVRELRNTLLAGRTPKDALQPMDWLYSGQPGLGRTFPKRLPNPARLVEPAYGRGL